MKDLTPVDKKNSEDDKIEKVGDIMHKLRLSTHGRKHDVEFYWRLICKAAEIGDTQKMLTVFFHDMLLVDRVKPSYFLIHKLLQKLTNLGGHSEAAFRIVRKMKDIKMPPTSVTYSLLFSNCAKEIANHDMYWNLTKQTIQLVSKEEIEKIQAPALKAFNLWKDLKDNETVDLQLNSINALLLTVCRAGLLKESFIILDHFLESGQRPCNYTLSAMLEGCLHDRKSGFGLALVVFNRLVYQYKCKLSPHVFNTLLKVVKQCQFGNQFVIEAISKPIKAEASEQSFVALHEGSNDKALNTVVDTSSVHCVTRQYCDIIRSSADKYGLQVNEFLDTQWSNSSAMVLTLKSPSNMLQKMNTNVFNPLWLQKKLSPSDKLACIGGILGFISIMEQCSVTPHEFVFTSLVSCLPYNHIAPSDPKCSDEFFVSVIRGLMTHFKLPMDTAFTNALYKRNMHIQMSQPETIDTRMFDPYSWSIYSRKCRAVGDVNNFFKLLKDNQVIPNREIYYTLLRSLWAWPPRLIVLQFMHSNNIELDRAIIANIEDEIAKTRDKIKHLTDTGKLESKFVGFYNFQKLYAHMLSKQAIEPITTGDRKIIIDELPDIYKQRDNEC